MEHDLDDLNMWHQAKKSTFNNYPEVPYKRINQWHIVPADKLHGLAMAHEVPTSFIYLGTCFNCRTPGKVISTSMMYDQPSFCLECISQLFTKSIYTDEEMVDFLEFQEVMKNLNYLNAKSIRKDAKRAYTAVREQLAIYKLQQKKQS